MSSPLSRSWTQEQFFAWEGHGEGRYEFDGFEPVAMTGGTVNHGIVSRKLHRALDRGLQGSQCQYLGPDAGLATMGAAVRYPDALVTCAKLPGNARTVPGVVVVFEVLSPTSGRVDRILKLREYAAVPSIRRYVILEFGSAGLTSRQRSEADQPWTTTALAGDDVLLMPEIGVEISLTEIYAGVDFSGGDLV